MELKLKSMLNKMVGNKKESKEAEEMKANLDNLASRCELGGKMNMLDADLSRKRIGQYSKLQKEDSIHTRLDLSKTLADEQEEYNYDFLLNSKDLSSADKLDKFAENEKFHTAVYLLTTEGNSGYGNHIRDFSVSPNTPRTGVTNNTNAICSKFENIIASMPLEKKVEFVKGYMKNSHSDSMAFIASMKSSSTEKNPYIEKMANNYFNEYSKAKNAEHQK